MNRHTFVGSILDASVCRQCGRNEKDHSDEAECESCGRVGPCELIVEDNILCCELCAARDAEIKAEQAALPKDKNERINVIKLMAQNRQIEYSVKILPDIFNAKMKSIIELHSALSSDESIKNPDFHLAQLMEKRQNHLDEVFNRNSRENDEIRTEQRVIQQYYNELANKLRAEEREQIHIKNLEYKPAEPKVKKPKAPSTKAVSAKESLPWVEKLEAEFPKAKGTVAGALQALILVKTAANPEAAYNILRGMYLKQQQAS